MSEGQPRIEYVSLVTIRRWPRNPKTHDLPAIIVSLRRFGFVAPLVRDEATGMLVAGHGRLDALEKMKADGEPAPGRIDVRGGEWYVPVLVGVAFQSELEAEAYGLADNRLSELGFWNEEALADVAGRLSEAGALAGTGYDVTDLAVLAAKLHPSHSEHGRPQFDELVDQFALTAEETKKDEKWLYVEWYGDGGTYEEMQRLLHNHIRGIHQLDGAWFAQVIREAIAREEVPNEAA